MRTASSTPKRKSPAAVQALPYPETHRLPDHLYWLGCYFRDVTEMEALEGLSLEMTRRRRPNHVCMALCGAQVDKRDSLKKSLGYVVKNGLLPFAHAQTTVFSSAGAVQ